MPHHIPPQLRRQRRTYTTRRNQRTNGYRRRGHSRSTRRSIGVRDFIEKGWGGGVGGGDGGT